MTVAQIMAFNFHWDLWQYKIQNQKKKKNWNKKKLKPGTLVVIVVVSWPICILLGEGEKAKKEKKT